jgi:acyl carrier protein
VIRRCGPLSLACVGISQTRDSRTALEEKFAAIWRDVLGLDAVGADDEFVALGGDSLQAMRIVHRIVEEFGLEITANSLLDGHTPSRMAALIEAPRATTAASDSPPAIRPRR